MSEITDAIRVVAGVIINNKQEVLISLRQKHQHLAGLWEFPGGKQDLNESPEQALQRELQEELGIKPEQSVHLYSQEFSYPGKKVHLQFYLVLQFIGQPCGQEGQELRWVATQDLGRYQFPDANTPLVGLLQNGRIRLD